MTPAEHAAQVAANQAFGRVMAAALACPARAELGGGAVGCAAGVKGDAGVNLASCLACVASGFLPRPDPKRRDVLAAIVACPDRGAVLPPSEQPECGCAELTACAAGRGRKPGAVTTADCYWCRAAAAAGG